MSFDLVLKAACEGCGKGSDLYGSSCKHVTLCSSCGKSMAENRARCHLCGTPITKLIREYNVRASANTDKVLYIGRFVTGLPPFSKKKSGENKWLLQKEGLQGRQITDSLREKYKNKPWVLEDETGQYQYQGQLEGAQSATYYLLMMHGKEFVAVPAGSWYNFNKIAQYKQLTLEEAEEKMSKRKHNATGYERWMMKAATNGAAAFGEMKKMESTSGGGLDGTRPKKGKTNDDGDHSDKGEEDGEEEEARKGRLGLNKKGVDDDDDDGGKGGERDFDDDDIEKGDDWEHEEIFTDDDEAVGNDAEEREDLAPEIPAPPEIKQDEDEEEDDEEEGGLSKSGKELKKLLGRAAGLNESDGDDDDDDEDAEDDIGSSIVLAPKQKDVVKDEATDNSPSKPAAASGAARGTPSTSKSKGKRKSGGDDAKAANGASAKKGKIDNDTKPSSLKDDTSSSKASAPPKVSAAPSSKAGPTQSVAPVTEEEIRTVLLAMTPVTTQDLVARFKARLKSPEDKTAFADILRRISKIQKTNGHSYVVLRDK